MNFKDFKNLFGWKCHKNWLIAYFKAFSGYSYFWRIFTPENFYSILYIVDLGSDCRLSLIFFVKSTNSWTPFDRLKLVLQDATSVFNSLGSMAQLVRKLFKGGEEYSSTSELLEWRWYIMWTNLADLFGSLPSLLLMRRCWQWGAFWEWGMTRTITHTSLPWKNQFKVIWIQHLFEYILR